MTLVSPPRPPAGTTPPGAPVRKPCAAAGRGQRGRLGTGGMLVWLLLVVALATGGWWWWRTGAASRTPAAATANGGNASGNASSTPPGAASAAPGAAAGGERARKGGGSGGGGAGGGSRAYYADRPTPVSVGDVKRQDVREIVNAIGTITAFNTVTVRTQVAGPLRAIHFKEGQEVKAGQLLAEIDPRPLQAALAQAQGTLAKDQAQLRNAQTDAKRYKDLLAKDSIARQQVDTQEALVRQLQGTIAVDQALVDSAKLQLSYTRITAPIGGRLGLRQVDVGNNIAPADANGIVSITQTRPINVTFAVPESKLAQLARQLGGITSSGAPARPLPVEAWNREQTIKLATGSVSAMDNAVDAATGTIKVKARFDNADNLLFPNQFVNVRLQIATLDDALTVPSNAVQRGSIGTYVYRVQDDKTVTVRKVEPGVVDGDRVVVRGELAAGDQVVTDGADRLREGGKIDPIPSGVDANVASAAGPAVADGQPAWMSRLPPEMVEKVKAMNPDERRAFLKKMRDQRGGGGGGSGGGGPAGG